MLNEEVTFSIQHSRFSMFAHTIKVRFRDLDALNHVNNVVYLTYLEETRIAMMDALGISQLMTRERGWILARSEIDYRFPAVHKDVLIVEIWPGEVRNSSFDLHYRIRREPDGKLIAEAKSVQVCYDYAHNRSAHIPAEWRKRLSEEYPRQELNPQHSP